MFYAEIPLFEDELHDNGSSHLLVRIVSTGMHCAESTSYAMLARYADVFLYPVPVDVTS